MNTTPRWAEALDISPDQVNAWTAEAPAGQPVLFYALERGLIAMSAYLEWAREHFRLPTLDNAFFVGDCDLDLVRGAHELESYAPWFFPVARWDDLIYVACVEPVDEMPPGYCQVLADARVMRQTWTATTEGNGTLLTFKPVPTEDSVVVEAPEGLVFAETTPYTLNLEGLSLTTDDDVASAPVPVAEAPVAPLAPSIPAPSVTVTSVTVVGAEQASPLIEPRGTRTAVPAAANTGSRSFYSASPDDVRLNLPSSEAGAVSRVFDYLNEGYAHTCILRCTDSMIRLYKFSIGMTPSAQGVAIDLSYPSFLRIVSRTVLPYHGYLVDSPIHREFFRGLGIMDLPASVTAAPLVIDGQLWGVLMTTGRSDQQHADALNPVESSARQLAEALSPTWRKLAA